MNMKLFLCCFFFMSLILACSKATVLEADKPNVLKYANNVKLEIVEFQTGWFGASDGEMVVPTVKLKIKNIGSVKSTQENVIELRFYNSNEEWGTRVVNLDNILPEKVKIVSAQSPMGFGTQMAMFIALATDEVFQEAFRKDYKLSLEKLNKNIVETKARLEKRLGAISCEVYCNGKLISTMPIDIKLFLVNEIVKEL